MKQMRPNCISKLAMYLQSKEPLIYLFIVNSDFIDDAEGKYLGPFPAGVKYENRRVKFFYKPDFLKELSEAELYFIVLHEAFHIFKRHLLRFEKLTNKFLLNYSQDAVINYEIKNANFDYILIPKMIEGGIEIPDDFIYEFRSLNKDAIETNRLYHWMLKNGVGLVKSDFLTVGSKVKIKSSGEYGTISKRYKSGNYEVKKEDKSLEKHPEENLIPVLKACDTKHNGVPVDFEVEFEMFQDKHFEYEKENGIEEKLFTEKLIRQAKKIGTNLPKKYAGNEEGNLIDRLEEILKPKVNWRRELKKRMNVFYSENSFMKRDIKSIINYPWNAVSQYGILGRYWIKLVEKLQTYIIFAIDTSGSVFSDRHEVETFFAEIDAAAKELEFNRRGQILTIQWDTKITEGLTIYKAGDWKKFDLQGGGGTSPEVVFNYLDKIYNRVGGGILVKENGISIGIPNEKKLPFLVFLTDGYFFNRLKEDDLRIYKNNKKNVLYFTRSKKDIFPKENYIIYEG